MTLKGSDLQNEASCETGPEDRREPLMASIRSEMTLRCVRILCFRENSMSIKLLAIPESTSASRLTSIVRDVVDRTGA